MGDCKWPISDPPLASWETRHRGPDVRSIHALGSGHAKTIFLWRPYRKWAGEERIPLALTVRRRRSRRSSASFAIHDISDIPSSYMDSVEEFASWRDPGGDPRVSRSIFWPDTPSSREPVASTAPPETQDLGSKPRLRARPRRRPGHDGGARATCCPIWRVGDIIWQS